MQHLSVVSTMSAVCCAACCQLMHYMCTQICNLYSECAPCEQIKVQRAQNFCRIQPQTELDFYALQSVSCFWLVHYSMLALAPFTHPSISLQFKCKSKPEQYTASSIFTQIEWNQTITASFLLFLGGILCKHSSLDYLWLNEDKSGVKQMFTNCLQ